MSEMSKIVIGVGGNGTHSVLAYIHLSRLLNEPVIKPLAHPETGGLLIIDADTSSNDPQSLWRAFKSLYEEENPEYGPQTYLMDPNPISFAKHKSGSYLFRKFMGDSTFLKYIFEEQHLDQDILYGFVGKPPVGSSVFYRKLREDILSEKVPEGAIVEDQFRQRLNRNTKTRVIFAGSFIGGTGAGVIPALSRTIKNFNKNFDIVYIAHSTWFALNGASPNALYNVTQDNLNKNVVGGMSFLVKNLDVFDTVIIIDYKNPIIRENDGGKEQKENRDFFYLLAAFLIRGYLKVKDLNKGMYSINLEFRSPSNKDTLYHRFSVKTEYDSPQDLISFNAPAKSNLYNKFAKAYRVYFYLTYFLKWIETPGFWKGANPMPDKSENLLKENIDGVKTRAQKEQMKLEKSLKWLESLRVPDDINEFIELPYELKSFPSEEDIGKVVDFFDSRGINVMDVNKQIKGINPKDVPGSFIKNVWEIL